MTRLADRIRGITSRPDQGGGAWLAAVVPATPVVMPAGALVTYYAPQLPYPWGTVAYQVIHPRYSADGAEIPATAAGPWGSIRPAGRP